MKKQDSHFQSTTYAHLNKHVSARGRNSENQTITQIGMRRRKRVLHLYKGKKTDLSCTALGMDISEQKSSSDVNCADKADIEITKVKKFKSKIGGTALIAADNNSVWVMYFDGFTMYRYDSNGDVVKSVEVVSSRGISDMVIRRSGDMIVTCQDKKIRCVTVDGEVSTLIDTERFYPKGVCLNDKEEIVVCMYSKGRSHVAVYSPDGRSKLREIRGIDSQATQQITSPCRVVCNGKDMCVINGDNYVVCVDERDNLMWLYDGKQATLQMRFSPRGICVDMYHNLLVTDRFNNCVHNIDRDGALIQVILTREQTGLSGHWGVCDKTGQVWVGNLGEEVIIATYLK